MKKGLACEAKLYNQNKPSWKDYTPQSGRKIKKTGDFPGFKHIPLVQKNAQQK
jgi:hypothetical protein